ncbi:GCN5-related N-acetyltransferase [Marinomonas posidonica IVIA-Po-181]|uniref:GCN5-related N-acetyltransferase n=1 Tax=Marinomonas posidonica (strain CECT 7376 / NCIMB 14433 / IVIA-Po-181) TaxID=491952 RepID=F6CZ08_MARPP|nr:GCN5-related N-acetyltransferase [Marinomonas posidonica IVIA-Po-181]
MINIRQAELEDLAAVVSMFEQYRHFYQCENNTVLATDFIKARMEQQESIIFIAETGKQNKEIAGFVQLYPLFTSTGMKKLWLLNDLFVDESYRKQGIAEKLIEAAKSLAQQTSARGLMLETSAKNLPAQALYEKVGFIKSPSFYYTLDL